MDTFKKYGVYILIGCGTLAALIFFSLNVPKNREANVLERGMQTIFMPVLKPAAFGSALLENAWDGYVNLVNVQRDNLRLRGEIRALNSRLAESNEAIEENKRLQRLLEMKESIKPPSLAATVIGEDASSWFRTLIINRGSSSGLKEGMAVISADGVVGQIVKTAANSSRVLLLTDHASGIAATIQRSRARGVVKGKGENLCSLEFTTREEDVKVGDQVVTSGIGGVFEKGLPIGEVSMVKRGEYGIFQTISIRPKANIAHLEEVLVVVRGGYE